MILAGALILDAVLGEPEALWRRVPHPAVLMGNAVSFLERHFNKGPTRKAGGVMTLGLLVGGALVLGLIISALPFGWIWELLIAAILLAQKSLVDHVRAVADALRESLEAGRASVAMIVGRDTAELDEAGVARAAIESAAENLSDGVVAPAFWFFIAGLPGILIYKAVNTADSMVGYMSPNLRAFGWASARFDDLLNWVPARLTALLILAVNRRWDALVILRRDARHHRSPNAGWPEAAMAPVLDVALSGPRAYEGEMRNFPWVYPEGRRDPSAADVEAACVVLWRVWWALLGLAAFWGLVQVGASVLS